MRQELSEATADEADSVQTAGELRARLHAIYIYCGNDMYELLARSISQVTLRTAQLASRHLCLTVLSQ